MVLEHLAGALTLAHQGLQTNLWGLACPFYCTSPGVGALLACFLLGLIIGAIGGFFLALRIFGITADPERVPAGAAAPSFVPELRRRARLQAYLHE